GRARHSRPLKGYRTRIGASRAALTASRRSRRPRDGVPRTRSFAGGFNRGVARLDRRLPQNAEGDLYVDSTCIDCDTCRQLAPATYARSDAAGMSYVASQPTSPQARERALMALVACPTASIGTTAKADVAAAARRFPLDFGGGVSFCGFTSED